MEDLKLTEGKKELYDFVYRRIWDLTKFDEELLEAYGLEKAKYIYVGSCFDYNLKARSSKFRYAIKHQSQNKELRTFLKALEVFYIVEFRFNRKQLDYYLYYAAEKITSCESKEGARVLERAWAGHYKFLEQFNDISDVKYILMSNKDCCYEEYYQNGISILKFKGVNA